MKQLTLRKIYKELGLRYDLRAARKLLGLDKDVPRRDVNRLIRDLYHQQRSESDVKTYQYTLTGTSQQLLKGGEWGAKDPISMSFLSMTKYKESDLIGVMNEDETTPALFQAWTELGPGYMKLNIVTNVERTAIQKMSKKLSKIPLYGAYVNIPQFEQFKGFEDTGDMMCVPEAIFDHLKLGANTKKLTLETIIDDLEEAYYDDDDDPYDPDVPADECPDEPRGKRGYTAEDIKRVLTKYKCNMRLIDINERVFMTNMGDVKADKNRRSFLGMVYNEHLYRCTDRKLVKSISEKAKTNTQNRAFSQEVYDKKQDKKKIEYEIIETDNLFDYYAKQFKVDNTIRDVRTKDGRIVKITYRNSNKVVCANPDKTYMEKLLGDKFENQNPITLFEGEFNKHFPKHELSSFSKATWDQLGAGVKHTGIVQGFNYPEQDEQYEYDINKCRTSMLLNNKLGDYERFVVYDEIQAYSGKITKGWYYVELESKRDLEFFMRGNAWYSGDYIKEGRKEGFKVSIIYELCCSNTLPHDYFKQWAKQMIKKYPDCYKGINMMIGHRGKTRNEFKDGYIETDWGLALSAFWDNNEEGVGFMYDKHVHKRLWKTLKGKLCTVQPLTKTIVNEHGNTQKIKMEPEQYIVEVTNYKTLYENDVPIFNKILENEMLKIYNLRERLGGRLIGIKTDAVIVEGKHNKIKLSDKIGGIKRRVVSLEGVKVKDIELDYSYKLNLDFKWDIVTETDKWLSFDKPLPTGSYLVTALAGYGKSTFVKQQPEYNMETTLLTGFTNVSVENISNPDHPAHTLNSYFGIDCFIGKCSEKRLKNLKSIDTIIVTEVFMVPSYIMAVLLKIKEAFPNIKFICEGDPEQNRPVKEEKVNWLNTRLLHQLCDGNLVKLTINKRNEETVNYHKILDGKPLPASKYEDRDPQKFNITKTNKMRLTLNHEVMDKSGYFIKRSKANKYSQDIWLTLDTPIMCVKNDKDLGLKNGKMYKLKSISKDAIVLDTLVRFTDAVFASYFVVAFAVTNHKIQGLTIREQYNIYEWKAMTRREKYTAYSRTSDGDNVKIITDYAINHELVNELERYFANNYVIYQWSSTACNDTYIGHTNHSKKRKDEHIKDSATKSNDLYVRMRETGVETWSMDILEEFYAENREEAEAREQEYITMMQPNLNMCAAKKI